jgi:hypothetical protein
MREVAHVCKLAPTDGRYPIFSLTSEKYEMHEDVILREAVVCNTELPNDRRQAEKRWTSPLTE